METLQRNLGFQDLMATEKPTESDDEGSQVESDGEQKEIS